MSKLLLTNIPEKIKKLYSDYFDNNHLNLEDGTLISPEDQKIWGRRFATYPFVGSKYGQKTKILFIGLDVGVDNNLMLLENRRDQIEQLFTYENFLKNGKSPNPHMLGTMLCALHELNKDIWETIKNLTRKKLKDYGGELINNNPIPFIALTNVYKYVSIGRKKLRGPKDRVFLSYLNDLDLLRKEVEILKPDKIFLQSSEYKKNQQLLNFFKSFPGKIYVGPHPSAPHLQTSAAQFDEYVPIK